MHKFIIFGANGMLAHAIRNHDFFKNSLALNSKECNITQINCIEKYIQEYKPEYLINCAAYTDVTKAENDIDIALKVNADGAENLAILAKKYACKLVHYSTDYVFKGDENIIYSEDLPTNPVNKYGLSKQKGEEKIFNILPESLIIRVSWLYGENGKNFVSTISSLMQNKSQLKIVSDQFGKTTFTNDAAEGTKNLIISNAHGIYHFANDGVSSRYEFTQKIYKILKKEHNFECEILPIKASEYPDSTPRPSWSILGTEKYTQTTGFKIRSWEDALEEYSKLLIKK